MHTPSPRPPARRPVRYVIRREAATRAELLAGGWTDTDLHEFPWPIVVHAYAVDERGAERPVPHHVRHSPTGFEIGYEGSGPAELARCLLIDYFDLHELAEVRDRHPLPVSYQQFKRDLIASIPRQTREHTIETETIETCVCASRSPAGTPNPKGAEMPNPETSNIVIAVMAEMNVLERRVEKLSEIKRLAVELDRVRLPVAAAPAKRSTNGDRRQSPALNVEDVIATARDILVWDASRPQGASAMPGRSAAPRSTARATRAGASCYSTTGSPAPASRPSCGSSPN
jgi:uncharacterized protein DUF6166